MEEKIQENQINQPDLPRTPVTVEKKKVNPLTIVILLIAILLVGVGGVYAGMQLGKKQTSPNEIISESETPTQTVATAQPEPTTISTPAETANWKTYKGFDFSFSYPPNWIVVDWRQSQPTGQLGQDTGSGSGESQGYVSVRAPDSSKDETGVFWFYQYEPEKNKESDLQGLKDSIRRTYGVEASAIKINGVLAAKYEYVINDSETGSRFFQTAVYVDKRGIGKTGLEIFYRDNMEKGHLKVFDQILSTFKFTN